MNHATAIVFFIVLLIILVCFFIGGLPVPVEHCDQEPDSSKMAEKRDEMKRNLEAHFKSQATVRGTDESHKLEERGATPRPATNFAGDSVSNAGDANCEIQAGTGEPPVATMREHPVVGNAAVVNAPLSQSSLSASKALPITDGMVAEPRETEGGK